MEQGYCHHSFSQEQAWFIDGSSTEPADVSAHYKSWSRCNDMVISWILNSLSKSIAESVLYSKTAREIWKELEARFGQCNGAQLYQLQRELNDDVQGASDIAGYFTKVKQIWDELDALNTFDHCSCKYTCGGKKKTLNSHQDGRLIQFLMGLNEAYSSVKSSILMMDPLPTVSHAYSLLIQDEKQREVHVAARPSEATFLVTNQKFNNNQRTNSFQKFNSTAGPMKHNSDKPKGGNFALTVK
ncbi:uncharacterized protein [Nicotiana sylvestris]|uniref:uncharacterized protein n=1 Tax=Nicotiana sylvestris TaxID=4096 RepID=UPI00388C6200